MTVRLGAAGETMAANNARETAALALADDVDKLLAVKDIDQNAIASLDLILTLGVRTRSRLNADLAELTNRRCIALAK